MNIQQYMDSWMRIKIQVQESKEYEHGQEPNNMNNRDQAKELTTQFMNKDEDKMQGSSSKYYDQM